MEAVHKLQNAVKTQASDMRDELQALASWEKDMLKKNTRTTRLSTEALYSCPIRGSAAVGGGGAGSGEKGAAERAKEDGNEQFRSGKYEEAIRAYSVGIDKDRYGPVTHLLFSNRAMCWLKLQEFDKAVEDATSSLDLNRTYFKAYYRRALARRAKGMLKEARGDLETVLAFAPNDADTINELKEVTSALRLEEAKKAAATTATTTKRKKLVIEEVDDEEDDDKTGDKVVTATATSTSSSTSSPTPAVAVAPQAATPAAAVPPSTTLNQSPPQQHSSVGKAPTGASEPLKNVKRNPRVEELPDEEEPVAQRLAQPTAVPSAVPVKPKAPPAEPSVPSTPSAASTSSKSPEAKKSTELQQQEQQRQPSINRRVALKEPATFTELERTFQDIGNDEDAVSNYITILAPSKFPALVGVSLTPELLCGVVKATLRLPPDAAYKWMLALASVKRVDELFMLLSTSEEEVVKSGVEHARKAGGDMDSIEEVFA